MDPIIIGGIALATFLAVRWWEGRKTIGKTSSPSDQAASKSSTGVGVNIPWIPTPGGNASGKTGQALVGNYVILGTQDHEVGVYVTGYQNGQYAANISFMQPPIANVKVGDWTNFVDADVESVIDRQTGQAAGWPTGASVR